jgi:tetratricopeptide (TPR) repeat protein
MIPGDSATRTLLLIFLINMLIARSSADSNVVVAMDTLLTVDTTQHTPSAIQTPKLIDEQWLFQEEIRYFEREKCDLPGTPTQYDSANKPIRKSLDEIIAAYETLIQHCIQKGSERCAYVILTLAGLYKDKARENYTSACENFEVEMRRYDSIGKGTEPVKPVPDYSKSLALYQRLVTEYPDFVKLSDVYFQMAHIYLLRNDLEKVKRICKQCSEKFPDALRIDDMCINFTPSHRADSISILQLERLRHSEYDKSTWCKIVFRKAELYYRLEKFDTSVRIFNSWLESIGVSDSANSELKSKAVDYMACCFAEMKDGIANANNFFGRLHHPAYEPIVLYAIGSKVLQNGEFSKARSALCNALEKFPDYCDAPEARQQLIECYVALKEFDKATTEREHLVDDYNNGSHWYAKNSKDTLLAAILRENIRRALINIADYWNSHAWKTKNKDEFFRALAWYSEFIKRFPEDKWHVLECSYFSAGIYSFFGEYQKSADLYWFVAIQNLDNYPVFKPDSQTGSWAIGVPRLKGELIQSSTQAITLQYEAGYEAIVALSKCIDRRSAKEHLPVETAFELPETQLMLEYITQYNERFPQIDLLFDIICFAGRLCYHAHKWESAMCWFLRANEIYSAAEKAGVNCLFGKEQINEVRKMLAEIENGTTGF